MKLLILLSAILIATTLAEDEYLQQSKDKVLLNLINDDIPINEYPFIMSHDAGTGYIEYNSLLSNWSKTQSGGLYSQLECGVRSFDIRPKIIDNKFKIYNQYIDVDVELS